MAIITLEKKDLMLRVSTRGGVILAFSWNAHGQPVPLLRPSANDDVDALGSSCYPLVPFGNRVRGNEFEFGGKTYRFTANTLWDPHYLHGEGWDSRWTVSNWSEDELEMSFAHKGGHTPYIYRADQHFRLVDGGVELRLTVENTGEEPLPFGLGWHPYFPVTPATTLFAPARKFWTEVEGWLPGEAQEIPPDLNFGEPIGLPDRWVNNGFQDWSGEAVISWPERQTQLQLTADPVFKHAFVFVSDTTFDPDFQRDYFCFEPMTHLANGHNLPDLGDLKVLAPGQSLSGSIRMRPSTL
ncbi:MULTISPECIES: aldose 1-epimerase [unclassified Rhizobium]|uniref:aldose 1-epimerase n=1 Tax=unclassified Rhizobium TaxID=2613769 RepID=UPI0016127765|nr:MULTISPECIES: aldose 1-epimerase [unclassified Rhizobium]MBB3386176.1 aldose 1-epimerase [Rhizobium sp. BK098]MBB3571152.1 aldose 1-epimerase [Rhizobium sp. BK491]MBB3617880.1 aldose 1-epimerase [Rhizobium sp. BK609]MBB3683667.1 aldose 1-epimerase [Rhizobium sp. BK612]